ncbi:MAG TPA: urease accessory protein UreD [Verrucomicrobiae bacterium]|nr:urease accessory protein UreD [Verrucomicrobiae bacterium]
MKARLELRFEACRGKTRLRLGSQEPPWRVIRAFPLADGGALVHLHNVSGGVLAGDTLSLDVHVGPGARAQITTTGASRLYRHRPGLADSEQEVTIRVEDSGLLEYLPDAVIPFTGSRHAQRTTIWLAERASLFAWETMAPGRQAMGEQFAFESLRLRTRIESSLRPLVFEDFCLEPDTAPPGSPARLGGYTYMTSFYAIQVGRPAPELRELEHQLGEIAVHESRPGCTIWGASALAADGVMVRGLSTAASSLPATLAGFWKIARRFLTGEDAVPPRKLK